MAQTKEQLVEQIKAEVQVIAETHGKAALHDVNEKVVPLMLDLMAVSIPGQVDDMIIAAAKPVVQDTLTSAIESI